MLLIKNDFEGARVPCWCLPGATCPPVPPDCLQMPLCASKWLFLASRWLQNASRCLLFGVVKKMALEALEAIFIFS